MVLRPSSYAKLIQPKQTNPQPNPNTTLLLAIIVNIRGGPRRREIGVVKQLPGSY